MKKREMKSIEELCDKIRYLEGSLNAEKWSGIRKDVRIKELEKETEELKEEKAKLLEENINLLCKMRHLLEMDLGKKG